MSEVELYLIRDGENCTIYTLQFLRDMESEFEKFVSKPRLYCLRLSDRILVLGNGGVKRSQKYEDDSLLNGYVMTLQKFEQLLKQEVANGNVNITESTIETDNIFVI
ncbi:MAG: hypothetical protein ACI4BC_05605 [Muribaculaceae bacterium]